MKIHYPSKITPCDLVILPLYSGKNSPELLREHSRADFEGKTHEIVMLYQKDKRVPRMALVGLGNENEESPEIWRKAGATVAKAFKANIRDINLVPPKEKPDLIAAFIEGMQLAHYQYEAFLSDKERRLTPLETIHIVLQAPKSRPAIEAAVEEAMMITDVMKKVRDMVNAPSNRMTPKALTENAQKIKKQSGKIRCTILEAKKLKKMGMGCLVSVGQSSQEGSKLIVLEYKNKPLNKKPLVLIGKGICFDSGGINLKTHDLVHMKYDMTGAAIILGIFDLLSRMNLPLHIVGLAACAENLIGKNATRPGDILTAYDGTTVEVTNTDAEGRLVLSDAIAYANKHYKPEAIVDVATLTGGAIVALGYDFSALITNNPEWGGKIKEAAKQVDEKVWELPLDPDYKNEIKSSIADIKNFTPEVSASTIMGGAFLSHFVKETPWVHLDMGGSAWTPKEKPYYPKGATGRNVRTLWQFLKNHTENLKK